ncbi:xanthine dehydrogenase family protein subunit M [Amorphus sp. 3PC139-8]|uniref:FAD binding domain-containing protein n=1 Tax=Amorphus sp. 3PC139-8 TaxID=2735676 RepID=UPI00345C8637
MKPAPFELHQPTTVEDALAVLGEVAEEGGLVLAGGQSLVPMMALRVAFPPHLVDINKVAGLDAVTTEGDELVIGAVARHATFHRPLAPGPLGHLMATVSRSIAHYPIRMRGTFCGSLAHADPASEWCLVAATLGAQLEVASASQRRRIAVEDFLEGAMTTALDTGEMLLRARLPLLSPDVRFGFYEFSRRAGDYALGMALATVRVEDGRIVETRLGLGAIEETARRIPEAEAVVVGEKPSADLWRAAGDAAAAAVDPMEDAATSADYRRDLASVCLRRALERTGLVDAGRHESI